MAGLRRTAATWWRAVRGASRGRVVYECALMLFAALTNLSGVVFVNYTEVGSTELLLSLGTAAAALVLVPLRLVRPVTALVLGSVVSIPAGGTSLLISILSASTGYRAKKPLAIVFGYSVALACAICGVMAQTDPADFGPMGAPLFGLTLFAFMCVLPGAIAAMIAQRRLLVMTMHQRNIELHAERLLVAGQAQARERNRIAAELHDSLGHRLTLISMYAGGLSQNPTQNPTQNPAAAGARTPTTTSTVGIHEEDPRTRAVGLLRDTSSQAMTELRQILKVLHQDEPAAGGGRKLDEVEQTVEAARQTGTLIELVRVGQPRPLSLLAEHAGYRVVQEGITNALKHAGGAPVRVEVRYDDEALFIEVRNRAGRPHPGPSSGQGLHGLTERVRLAGGVLSQGPTDDGFRLGAMLPYEADVPAPGPAPASDFPPDLIRRSSRRQRIGFTAVVLALLVTLGSCVGWAATLPGTIPIEASVYQAVRVGDDRDRLRHLLPEEEVASTRTDEQGRTCETFLGDVTEQPDFEEYEITYEFCYSGDKLVSKQKVRTEGTP
ncbi:sensor histidine kinase [Kineosporia succinea]|uniref:histidine kinase n=1 Tax=Kineosporia succinea TaxID=84632 RepID=A0ABT9NX15_9ACTN|nr:histidine kinase [Kineosporia succinea]MDP9824962.1 signal transduction histidine kinase [Kineosporia succinea]